jgi:hypothetical protein
MSPWSVDHGQSGGLVKYVDAALPNYLGTCLTRHAENGQLLSSHHGALLAD